MNKQPMIRILVALAAVGLSGAVAMEALAAEVTPEMAAKAVRNWRSRKGQLGMTLGTNVSETRRVEHDGAAFHVVKFKGGGFAVTPTDTTVRPVILFSEGDDLEVSDENPAIALLVGELAARAKPRLKLAALSASATATNAPTAAESAWDELLADVPVRFVTMGKSSIDDVRVEPFVKTTWQQGGVWSGPCYNYYTPGHSVCGCVATTMAQIMRYFEYPNTPVEPFTRTCRYAGSPTNLTAQAGLYSWALMPDSPSSKSTEAELQAVGKLTSDAGIALGMAYNLDSSTSSTMTIPWSLETYFGYPKPPIGVIPDKAGASGVDGTFGEVLRANFDAKLPVALGLPGHSILGDGYGYIGDTLYYHLNMGWGSSSCVWYAPPEDLLLADKDFTGFTCAVHNIYTNAAMSGLVIASGRVTEAGGGPAEGVTVWAEDASGQKVGDTAVSDKHGIYALFVKPGSYRVIARRPITDESGCEIGEYAGSTTARPLKCYTVSVGGGSTYTVTEKPQRVEGNDSGCDISLKFAKYGPEVVVAFTGEAVPGEDFASLTAPVRVQVKNFGYDYSSATLVVTLSSRGTVVGTQEFLIETLGTHDYEVEFKGLTAGEMYDLSASVVFGSEPTAEAGGNATAARVLTVESPASAVLASDEIVITARIDDFSVFRLLPPMDAGASALTVVWDDDATGKFAYWDGAAWQKTGVTAELEATNVVSVLRDLSGARRYRVKKNGGWIDLAPVRGAPAVLSEFTATGAVEVVSVTGNSFDTNRIARADGTAEYADLAAAIAAGETQTLTPLWKTRGVVSTNGIDLMVLSVVDPNGLLTLAGDPPLSAKTGSDGTKIYCYGNPAHQAAAANSDYLKATGALGVSKPITGESEVRLGNLEAEGGALSFDVSVDEEPVVRERVKEYVRVADGLAGDDWRAPKEGEISVDEGRVTVVPETADRAFLRVVLPKD